MINPVDATTPKTITVIIYDRVYNPITRSYDIVVGRKITLDKNQEVTK
jgi:hypothetical protein